MDVSLSGANCGACGEEGTLVPVNISDLNESPDGEDWVLTWKCSSCGVETGL